MIQLAARDRAFPPDSACEPGDGANPGLEPEPLSGPFDNVDVLEELEERIVLLAAHLHSGNQQLVELVAEYDRLRGWELGGHRSCAHWLAFRTGIDLHTAREKVRAGRCLRELPETDAAMRRGELSFSKVRALTRVATAENESDLLELARDCTAAQLERMVRGWKLGSREDEAERERRRIENRSFSIVPDADGMYEVRGRLTPVQGALLMRAVEAASDALYRERGFPEGVPAEMSGEETRVPAEMSLEAAARRRADAVALLAERALAAGFGGSSKAEDETERAPAPISGTRAERYQVVLHVDAETLREDGGLGRSELADGTRVSAETSRRFACDGSIVPLKQGPGGSVLDIGRKSRTVSPAMRRALEARDRGCRFPGCGLRFADAHHVRHWADGGETSLDNLLLLCGHHHRLVHEGEWKVEWWSGKPAFVDPRGQVHLNGRFTASACECGPELDMGADPVVDLVQRTRARGADPDFYTAGARWKSERDIPDDVWLRAREAVD